MKNCSLFPHLFLLAALLLARVSFAQTDFSKVDANARKIPFPEKQNTVRLASDLTAGLKTEKEKARAIFVWIADNIRYDIKTVTDEDVEAQEVVEKQKPAAVLKSKKAVCEGYSNLFNELCEAAGLKVVKVDGFTKNEKGRVSRMGHAWNLVRVDGDWGLVDATWGAGSVDVDDMKFTRQFKEQFFLSKPEVLILDHWPNDPMFQLLPKPVDFQKFKMDAKDRVKEKESPTIAFPNPKDSLDAFVSLDAEARLLNSWTRIVRYDAQNGSANYSLAQHHFNRSVRLFNEHQAEMNRLAQNKVRLTLPMLQDLEKVLLGVQAELDKSHQFASQVPSGHRAYRTANALRREVENKRKTLAQMKKQNEEMKARTKG